MYRSIYLTNMRQYIFKHISFRKSRIIANTVNKQSEIGQNFKSE